MHQMLLNSLPDSGKGIVHFGHTVTEVSQPSGGSSVTVSVKKQSESGDSEKKSKHEADLLVAADGSMSATRAQLVPNESRRSGPSASPPGPAGCVAKQRGCI